MFANGSKTLRVRGSGMESGMELFDILSGKRILLVARLILSLFKNMKILL